MLRQGILDAYRDLFASFGDSQSLNRQAERWEKIEVSIRKARLRGELPLDVAQTASAAAHDVSIIAEGVLKLEMGLDKMVADLKKDFDEILRLPAGSSEYCPSVAHRTDLQQKMLQISLYQLSASVVVHSRTMCPYQAMLEQGPVLHLMGEAIPSVSGSCTTSPTPTQPPSKNATSPPRPPSPSPGSKLT